MLPSPCGDNPCLYQSALPLRSKLHAERVSPLGVTNESPSPSFLQGNSVVLQKKEVYLANAADKIVINCATLPFLEFRPYTPGDLNHITTVEEDVVRLPDGHEKMN